MTKQLKLNLSFMLAEKPSQITHFDKTLTHKRIGIRQHATQLALPESCSRNSL